MQWNEREPKLEINPTLGVEKVPRIYEVQGVSQIGDRNSEKQAR